MVPHQTKLRDRTEGRGHAITVKRLQGARTPDRIVDAKGRKIVGEDDIEIGGD